MSASGDGLDTENDDEDDAAEERVSKKAKHGSKGSSRCRMTWKQKALAVQHYEQMVPKPTHDQLGEWCKQTFKLDQTPSKCAVGSTLMWVGYCTCLSLTESFSFATGTSVTRTRGFSSPCRNRRS